MDLKKITSIKWGSICGIIGSFIAIIAILIATGISSWFSWNYNYLSDLGGSVGDPIYGAHGAASFIFDLGMIFAGLFGMIFAIAFMKNYPISSIFGRIGKVLLIFDLLALMLIGVFPEPTGKIHGTMALIFFVLVPGSLIFISFGMLRKKDYKLGTYTFTLGLISALSSYLLTQPPPVGENAIAEIIPAIFMIIFIMTFGIIMIKSPKNENA